MQFDSWEPIYLEILDDFGFSRKRDEEAAEVLSSMLPPSEPMLLAAVERISGKDAVICGNGPSLEKDIKSIQKKARIGGCIFIVADGATAVLLGLGIVPDVIVTDLDGPFPDIKRAHDLGSLIVVHAHGDNIDALRTYVPQLRRVLGTAQSMPLRNVYNFGGFTDGDRCVFLAKSFGAESIRLVGFDFDDERVTPRKKKKLSWARRLIGIALDRGSG